MFQEVATTYNNLATSSRAGNGGMCMWLAPTIHHLINSQGQSHSGRY